MMNIINDKNEQPGNLAVSSKNRDENIQKKILIAIIVTLMLFIAALWIWKNSQITNIRKEAAKQSENIQALARKSIVDANVKSMEILAKAYVWAVRSELLEGNLNQVNLYANDMVKEPNFQSIIVANEKGTIISSTNKKNEGNAFSTAGKADYLSIDHTIVDNINDSILVMSSPIMGFNNKLGTLMITYKIEEPKFLN